MSWVVVPAAGAGRRFGSETPKQYHQIAGRTVLEHTLLALLSHPGIDGVMLVLAAEDPWWPGWRTLEGKPVLTCLGGAERSDSVLAGVRALPASVSEEDWVLVHDAARPCVHTLDLTRLLAVLKADPVGALLAAPVRDTLKRADDAQRCLATEPRERLWRALTPQVFRRGSLQRALESAQRTGALITDEASAFERLGLKPQLVEGRDDNLKITTPADLAVAAYLLARGAPIP